MAVAGILFRSDHMQKFTREAYENLLAASGPVNEVNLFILLGKVQDTFGYIPRDVLRDLAVRCGVPDARIYGALTSYRDFKLGPEE